MTTFLVIVAVTLGVLAIAQLAKVFDLSASLSKDKGEIKQTTNKLNSLMWKVWTIAFFGMFIWLLWDYGTPLPEAASLHGVETDKLMLYNMYFIIVVFFMINGLLFYFASKYYYKKDRKALFFPHDNRLELLWTIVPTIVLAFIIIFGLITWFDITGEPDENTQFIEITSEQYTWTVRYPGADAEFGGQSYNLIGSENETGNANTLGIATTFVVEEKAKSLTQDITNIKNRIEEEASILAESQIDALEDEIYKLKRQKQRILDIDNYEMDGLKAWDASKDDKIVKELHLIIDQEVEFSFKSKDVIHSAYMPHFRTQMNSVPGMINKFKMTPTITTDDMRLTLDNDEFNYVLLCNKVCGGGHWNMQIPIIVETQESYDKWMAEQATFVAGAEPVKTETTTEELVNTDSPDIAEGQE